MRHAWMILAHNQFSHLEKLISFLDSDDADIFLHIDAKTPGVDPAAFAAFARRSRVIPVARHAVAWGDFSMVEAELELLHAAVSGKYDYYHLLSGADAPVKTRRYIEEYFTRFPGRNYISFLRPVISREDRWRVEFFFPFQKLNIRRVPVRRFLRNASIAVQLLTRTDRTRAYPPDIVFQKGAQWFDITHELAALVLSREEEIRRIFRSTYCPDEMVLQTVVMNSPLRSTLPPEAFDNDCRNCGRYIDWKRGNPYTFSASDEEELLHTPDQFLFARIFDAERDEALVEKLFTHFGEAPSRWPVMDQGLVFVSSPNTLQKNWLTFRCKVIHDFMQKAAGKVHSVAPDVRFGVYVGAWFSEYYRSGVNWTSSRYDVKKNESAYKWAPAAYQKTGFADLLDFIFLGAYAGAASVHGNGEWTMEGFAKLGAKRLCGTVPFAAGPDIGNGSGFENGHQEEIIPDIVATMMDNADGLFVFDLCHIRMFEYWDAFKEGIQSYLETH